MTFMKFHRDAVNNLNIELWESYSVLDNPEISFQKVGYWVGSLKY